MSVIKEFREFFLRVVAVTTGNKPDQESNYPIEHIVNNKTVGNRFLNGHFPGESVFKKLFESITFKLNSEDTATESTQGLVKKVSDANAISRDSSDGDNMTTVVLPHQIPEIENYTDDVSVNILEEIKVVGNVSRISQKVQSTPIPYDFSKNLKEGQLVQITFKTGDSTLYNQCLLYYCTEDYQTGSNTDYTDLVSEIQLNKLVYVSGMVSEFQSTQGIEYALYLKNSICLYYSSTGTKDIYRCINSFVLQNTTASISQIPGGSNWEKLVRDTTKKYVSTTNYTVQPTTTTTVTVSNSLITGENIEEITNIKCEIVKSNERRFVNGLAQYNDINIQSNGNVIVKPYNMTTNETVTFDFVVTIYGT